MVLAALELGIVDLLFPGTCMLRQTHRNPPVSASQVLRLKVCSTTQGCNCHFFDNAYVLHFIGTPRFTDHFSVSRLLCVCTSLFTLVVVLLYSLYNNGITVNILKRNKEVSFTLRIRSWYLLCGTCYFFSTNRLTFQVSLIAQQKEWANEFH